MSEANDHDWIDLCGLDEVPAEGGRYIEHGRRALAVMRIAEANGDPTAAIRVMDDHCPHAGGSLSAGHIAEGCVICPWHAWPFDLDSGQCPDSPAYRVNVYPVRVEAGRVWAKVGRRAGSAGH